MKTIRFLFFSFMMAVGFLAGCSRNIDESCPVCHELNVAPQLTPMKTEYRVGDTMVLSLHTPFVQTHPDHYRTVNLSDFEPAYMPLLFLYYEPVATKTYYNRKSGYMVNRYEVLAGEDKGELGFFQEYGRYFLPEKKSDAYELRLRIVLKQPGYFSIGSRYGRYQIRNSPECFTAAFLFDTTRNNNYIRPLVGFESTNWQEDFYFRVLP
jgi:hypothetical protein